MVCGLLGSRRRRRVYHFGDFDPRKPLANPLRLLEETYRLTLVMLLAQLIGTIKATRQQSGRLG